jgi:hypothetical protein
MRRGQPTVFGLRSHVVLIETNDAHSSGRTEFTIEGSVAFLLVIVADIVLLVASSSFAAVPRGIVRWIGGAFLAVALLLTVLFVVLSGLLNLITPASASFEGKTSAISPGSFLAVGVCALGLGVLLGTSVVIDGPVDFAADAALLLAAGWVWRGRARPSRWPAGRHLLAGALTAVAITAAVVGVLLLEHA